MPDITWWGHSTVTVSDGGTRVLTDPVLTGGVAHLRRRRGPIPAPAARDADVVLISHLHSDHLHVRSLRSLADDIPLVVPRGARAAVPGLRLLADRDIREVVPGDVVEVGSVRVRVVPAEHDGHRVPWAHRSVTPVGYVIAGTAVTYFAGDTDLYDGMAAAVGRCDVALLPVGGWGPGLGEGHMNSARAAQAAARLEVPDAVPIHFGTLWPIGLDRIAPDEFLPPGARFRAAAARAAPGTTVHELTPGQTVSLGGVARR